MDLLLHRYHRLEDFLNLPLETGLALILQAKKAELDARLHLQWAVQLPIMAVSRTVISFEDYKARVTGANVDLRPTEEILEELDEVEVRLNGA